MKREEEEEQYEDHLVQEEQDHLVQDLQPIEIQENTQSIIPEREYITILFAKSIENYILNSDYAYNRINYYSHVEIDKIPIYIYIGKFKKGTYYFYISVSEDVVFLDGKKKSDRDSIYVYTPRMENKKYIFNDVISILNKIEEIKNNYKWMENRLICPKEMEYCKLQRVYFPTPSDKNCSVCYEYTSQYTVCKHPICFQCRYKCLVSNNHYCPICKTGELKRLPSEFSCDDEDPYNQDSDEDEDEDV